MPLQPADPNAPTRSVALPAERTLSSKEISQVELEAMFRTLDGYEPQIDDQQQMVVLGEGSFGKVYLARECDLDRPVAVKTLKPELRTDRKLVTQFFQEGVLTSQLQHPGIPPVHAMGLWYRFPAIVMKVVVGKTLKAYLNGNQHLAASRSKVVDYFLQVCRSVAYAHAHNTLHLDLKPGNVMIGAQDEIQVMDWGLGRVADKVDDSATGAGTLAYMPPEQANRSTSGIGPYSDVFSLGAMLAEILTGKPPYVAKSLDALKLMVIRADLDDGIQRLNDLENSDRALAPLTSLARWCLSKDPTTRPHHAGIIVDALVNYQEGLRLQVQNEIADRARREQQAIAEHARREQQAIVDRARQEHQATIDRVRFRVRATIFGTVVILSLIATASTVWSIATEQARNAGFLSDLAQIDELIRIGADAAFDEAERDLAIIASRAADGSVSEAVQSKMDEAKADLGFITKRNEARQSFAEFTNGLELNTGTALQYGALFQQYGISVKDTEEAARRIRSSRIQSELLAGLDHWSLVADDIQKPLLWKLAMEASKPGWCQRFRTPENRANPETLKSLVKELPWGELSATEFESTARGLVQKGLRAESLVVLRKAVQRFPKDFWLNLLLGQEIAAAEVEGESPRQQNALEAISYLRAALAINENAHVYSEIARVSLASDDLDAAELAANQALKLDINTVSARYIKAQIRLRQNKPREATSIARQALEIVSAQSPVQRSRWRERLNELLEQADRAGS